MSKFDDIIAKKSKIYENIIGANVQPGVQAAKPAVPPIAGLKPQAQQTQQPQQQGQQDQQQNQPQQQQPAQKQQDPMKAAQDAIAVLLQHKDNPAVQQLLAKAMQPQQAQPTQQNVQ